MGSSCWEAGAAGGHSQCRTLPLRQLLPVRSRSRRRRHLGLLARVHTLACPKLTAAAAATPRRAAAGPQQGRPLSLRARAPRRQITC